MRKPVVTGALPGRNGAAPLVRKGASFPFTTAAVAWVDLLGYGGMIAEAGFNPLHPKAGEAIRRLRAFHAIVAESSSRSYPTLVMNDGAAGYRDMSMRARSVTHEFIVNSWELFSKLKDSENASGYPGPRMVIATGFRMRGRRAGMDQTVGHFGSVMDRFQSGRISADQAIREASRIKRSFDIIPQLQANFAFTKAYVAESSGRKGGFEGSRCFIDLAFFDDPPPPWLDLGEAFEWTDPRLNMKASFAQLRGLPPWSHPRGGPDGVRDGLQIAQHLAGDIDVLKALHASPRLSGR